MYLRHPPLALHPYRSTPSPWAEVFIKLPGTDRFIKPPEKKSNITPIRGGLKVPIGTAIRLVYEDKEKTFGYEAWKTSKTISHDFMEP